MPALGTVNFSGSFSVYPNPAADVLHIDSALPLLDARIAICDLNGRVLFAAQNVDISSTHTLQTGNFASGIYLLSIESGTKTMIKKIIIK
jgi:hypothetical protein